MRSTLVTFPVTHRPLRLTMQDAYEADRIGLVVRNLELATEELKSLDIFDSITIELDKGTSGASTSLRASPGRYSLTRGRLVFACWQRARGGAMRPT